MGIKYMIFQHIAYFCRNTNKTYLWIFREFHNRSVEWASEVIAENSNSPCLHCKYIYILASAATVWFLREGLDSGN